jgi:pimeloyl-ACP methyl ester carboxylesterase
MRIITYIKLFILSLIQDSIIFVPHASGTIAIKDPAEYGLMDTRDKTVITQDGVTIHYWIKDPKDKTMPYMVFFQGNAGNMGDLKSLTEKNNDRGYRVKLLKDLANKGYGFIAVSLRGYGKSGGKPSEEGFVKDVTAIADLIQKEKYDVSIVGESLGCFSALKLMDILADRNIDLKGVTLIAPFSSMVEKVYETHAEFKKFDVTKYLKYNFDNKEIIEKTKYRGKILFIHGLEDKVSGIYHSKILEGIAEQRGINTKLVILKDAGHVSWDPQEVTDIIADNI